MSRILSMVSLATVAAVLLAACATREQPRIRAEAYGSLELPDDCRVIGVSSSRPPPIFSLNEPTSKREAAREMKEDLQGQPIDPAAAIILPVVPLLNSISASLLGGALGLSESELESSVRSISSALRDNPVDERVGASLALRLDSLRPGSIHPLAAGVPAEILAPGGVVRWDNTRRIERRRPGASAHPLAGSNVTAVVGWRISALGFSPTGLPARPGTYQMNEFNPQQRLILAVDLTAVRTDDWSGLGGITVIYESLPRKFNVWAANDARLLRSELEAALAFIQQEFTGRVTASPSIRSRNPERGHLAQQTTIP